MLYREFHVFYFFSGETGIRTPGTSQYNGFQDRRNRPLCHLSKTSSFIPLSGLTLSAYQDSYKGACC